jgi:hypothetical protein
MRGYRPAIAVFLCICSLTAFAARAQEEKDEVGPVEIDFSPLPEKAVGNNPTDYELDVVIRCKDGSTFKTRVTVVRLGLTAETVRDLVKASLQLDGWTVREVEKKRLVVEGCKDSPVKTVQITGISKDWLPTTKRIKEEDKKDSNKKD